MWADVQRDGRPAKYRWRPLWKFCISIPCSMSQILADARAGARPVNVYFGTLYKYGVPVQEMAKHRTKLG